jgi:hypothetical protein
MTHASSSNQDTDEPVFYQIRVKGRLDGQWSDWFDKWAINPTNNNETLISGLVTDQAELYGLLRKIRDLGLRLLSVNCIESSDEHC